MRIGTLYLTALAVLVIAASACGGQGSGESGAPAATAVTVTTPRPPAYTEIEVTNGGTIGGVVTIDGPIPERYIIHVDKDAKVFGETLPDESLLVSEDGAIENVVVFIEEIKEGKKWPEEPFVLNNHGGLFEPHVLVARAGARLQIVNSDPVIHNTHGLLGGQRTVFNVALPRQDQRTRRRLRRPGIVEVVCDSHDWMQAWVLVQYHPYFDITGEDGVYVITDVPPGTYRLLAWHEKLGQQEAEVTVTAGEQVQADFSFSTP
ncbi:MAG: carboxypeptidase regulatory-like domain-containing protein [Anaerolineae bacterium]